MKTLFVDLNRCLGCRTCELQCGTVRVSKTKELKQAVQESPAPTPRVNVHSIGSTSVPIQCRQCADAYCLDACPSGAIHREAASGKIVLDQQKCVGCWMCAMVCPFGAINTDLVAHKADKCDQCIYMEEPVCAAACPTGALQVIETGDQLREIQVQKRQQSIQDYIQGR